MALSLADIRLISQEVAKLLPVQDEVLTTKSVAAMMGISEVTVRDKAYRGELPAHKRGKQYYFSKKELTEFLTIDEY